MAEMNVIARRRIEDGRPEGPGTGRVDWIVLEVVLVGEWELRRIPDEDFDDGFFDWVAWWERTPDYPI